MKADFFHNFGNGEIGGKQKLVREFHPLVSDERAERNARFLFENLPQILGAVESPLCELLDIQVVVKAVFSQIFEYHIRDFGVLFSRLGRACFEKMGAEDLDEKNLQITLQYVLITRFFRVVFVLHFVKDTVQIVHVFIELYVRKAGGVVMNGVRKNERFDDFFDVDGIEERFVDHGGDKQHVRPLERLRNGDKVVLALRRQQKEIAFEHFVSVAVQIMIAAAL